MCNLQHAIIRKYIWPWNNFTIWQIDNKGDNFLGNTFWILRIYSSEPPKRSQACVWAQNSPRLWRCDDWRVEAHVTLRVEHPKEGFALYRTRFFVFLLSALSRLILSPEDLRWNLRVSVELRKISLLIIEGIELYLDSWFKRRQIAVRRAALAGNSGVLRKFKSTIISMFYVPCLNEVLNKSFWNVYDISR